jgi:hypothetical protein
MEPPTKLTREFAEIARLIMPKDTPNWLSKLLSNWASSLMLDRAVHARQPTKTQMRERLVGVIEAADSLLSALQSGSLGANNL